MRHRRPLLTLLVALLAAGPLAGCSNRDRLNPLDPANPSTGGRPSGFNAIAGYSSVRLTWDARPDLAIDGFTLSRQSPGGTWQPLFGLLPPTSSQYLDGGVTNGQRQRYRLDYVIRGSAVGRPAEDDATPGPARPWVADPGAGALLRLSPDGRDVALRETQLGQIYAIAADPASGEVWASARFDGTIWVYQPASGNATAITGVPSPYSVALNRFDGSAWISDLTGGVAHYNSDGTPASPPYIGLLDEPIDVAVSRADGSVWVAERNGNRVRHFNASGVPLSATVVGSPSRIDVDSLTRTAYVTSLDLGRVWHIAENGGVIDSTGAAIGPIGLAVDRARGRVWVADAAGARVLALDLATLSVLTTVGSVGTPFELAVDAVSGEVWVVARSERAVIRLAPDGTHLDTMTGFTDPVQVSVDPGVF